jgi:hypothetical protein
MASVFKLTRNSVDVDLLQANNAGWRTEQWRPRVATVTGNRMPPLVTETVDLMADATTHDTLATDFQDLDNYRWLAREYIKDRTQEHPVWLHAKMDNETGERRALVHDIELAWRTDNVDENGLWANTNEARVRANIVRGPFWEDTTANTKTAGSNVSILGGAYDYSGTDVVGDAPARLYHLTFTNDANTDEYNKAWIGFRSANKHGTLGNFDPVWECEDYTAAYTDVSKSGDATASPGGAGDTKAVSDFSSSEAWQNRLVFRLDDFYTTNYSDMYGRFVVLLRAKVGASTTCEVKLRHHASWGDGNFYHEGPILEVSATSWTMHNLGTFTIPVRNLHNFPLATWIDDYDLNDRFALWGRRTSGTNDLEMDCLIFVPADELFLYVDGINYEGSSAIPNPTIITQSPEGLWAVMTVQDAATDYWYSVGAVAPQGIGVPVGDGRMYCVMADDDNANTLGDTYDASMQLIPRWYNLRGSE